MPLRPRCSAAAHAIAGAGAGAEDRAEHGRQAVCGAALGLGQGEALAVVAGRDRPRQRLLQHRAHLAPVQGRHVGTELAPGNAVGDAGQADADRRFAAKGGVGALHQAAHGIGKGLDVVGRGGNAFAVHFAQTGVVGRQFDLGAADVDAVEACRISHRHVHRW
jgi:hypothetical protein